MPILHSFKENKLEHKDEDEVEIKIMGTRMDKESFEHNLHKNDITLIIGHNFSPTSNPPIKPKDSGSFRMKIVEPLTIHTPPSPHVAYLNQKCFRKPDFICIAVDMSKETCLCRKDTIGPKEAWKTIEDLAQYEEKEWNDPTFSKKGSPDYIYATLEQELESMECRVESLMRNEVLLEYEEDEDEVKIKMMGTKMDKESLKNNLHKNDITLIIGHNFSPTLNPLIKPKDSGSFRMKKFLKTTASATTLIEGFGQDILSCLIGQEQLEMRFIPSVSGLGAWNKDNTVTQHELQELRDRVTVLEQENSCRKE
nr:hypothetical protein [Tanacetum cinerariifolium]